MSVSQSEGVQASGQVPDRVPDDRLSTGAGGARFAPYMFISPFFILFILFFSISNSIRVSVGLFQLAWLRHARVL